AATFVQWLGAFGLMLFVTFALTWLSVGMGLVSKNVETASNLPMFLMLLPFLGSGFVPTDSMPPGLRWFADNQPFTPINATLSGPSRGGRPAPGAPPPGALPARAGGGARPAGVSLWPLGLSIRR